MLETDAEIHGMYSLYNISSYLKLEYHEWMLKQSVTVKYRIILQELLKRNFACENNVEM